MTSGEHRALDWHLNFQDEDYLQLSLKRLQDDNPPLDWCVQFADQLRGSSRPANGVMTLHDIGCNVGHFCRVLERIGERVHYRGYDISDTYLAIARSRYPTQQFSFLDIAAAAPEERADISIVSATLEHVEDWQSALNNILSTTERCLLLRSFFGLKRASDLYKKVSASQPYLIRQFTFEEVAEKAYARGFATRFLRDRSTDSVPQYLGCGITRTQYVAVMTKDG